VWHKADVTITKQGFIPFDEFNEENVETLDKYLKEKAADK
jgi:hypothetical protein